MPGKEPPHHLESMFRIKRTFKEAPSENWVAVAPKRLPKNYYLKLPLVKQTNKPKGALGPLNLASYQNATQTGGRRTKNGSACAGGSGGCGQVACSALENPRPPLAAPGFSRFHVPLPGMEKDGQKTMGKKNT